MADSCLVAFVYITVSPGGLFMFKGPSVEIRFSARRRCNARRKLYCA